MDDTDLLKKRFAELSARSASRGIWTYSEFLTMSDQDELFSLKTDSPFQLEGGFPAAERRIACFGSDELCGRDADPPVACLLVRPLSARFADALTHRDFLGALMSLGVRRETTGDIVVCGDEAYIFCLRSISDYICEQLTKIKHTSVSCVCTDVPETLAAPEPSSEEHVAASERIDAFIAAVYGLSRSESQELITGKRVFINGRITENTSRRPVPGDIISVRSYGRFIYDGIERETRKGRIRIKVQAFR